MTSLTETVLEVIMTPHRLMTENINPIVRPWPLMSSPTYTIGIILGYLYFCLYLGPYLMRKRKAFEIERIMIWYNAVQMIINLYLFHKTLSEAIFTPEFSFIVTNDEHLEDKWIYVYYYFLNKVLDMLDTIFMVLRKKKSQITFLHLYHHAMMVFASWFFVAYIGVSISAFFGAINTFVHIVMYFYYLLTAAKPEYKRSVWWKRHLTQLQLGQFIIVTLHATINVLSPASKFSKGLTAIFIPQGIIMFVLFWDFYKKEYKKKRIE